MSRIAVIKTGGKQYMVTEGQTVKVEKIVGEKEAPVQLDTLLIADAATGNIINLGQPSLGAKVSAKILETGKGEKITVTKFKSKTRYKRTLGHRQYYTKIKIDKIE